MTAPTVTPQRKRWPRLTKQVAAISFLIAAHLFIFYAPGALVAYVLYICGLWWLLGKSYDFVAAAFTKPAPKPQQPTCAPETSRHSNE